MARRIKRILLLLVAGMVVNWVVAAALMLWMPLPAFEFSNQRAWARTSSDGTTPRTWDEYERVFPSAELALALDISRAADGGRVNRVEDRFGIHDYMELDRAHAFGVRVTAVNGLRGMDLAADAKRGLGGLEI